MTRHRTTARGVLLLLLALGLAAAAAVARAGNNWPRPKAAKSAGAMVFPVIGPVQYSDDFGQPRAGGTHQGNDIMAAKRQLAVAAESGTVKFWTTSASAGCMLYLHGDSGTTYLYIHLNNDLTAGNDNRGTCVAGTAYAPGLKDGAHVAAGQPVGFVGDSGDANGIHPHLHFEVHPHDGAATDPYPYLQTARHLLFAAPAGSTFTLVLDGTVISSQADAVKLKVSLLRQWPAHLRVANAGTITVSVPPQAGDPLSLVAGQAMTIWTAPAVASLSTQLGNGLVASKIR